MGRPKTDLDAHYVVNSDGCWIWRGGTDADGYGSMSSNRRAHRVYYARAHGPIPEGMVVCHTCDVRRCVNPGHLFLGTPSDNNDDKVKKQRHAHGTRVPTAKLTDSDVVAILASDDPCRVLADMYGVSDVAISYIKIGKTWKHIERPAGYEYTPYRAPGNHARWEDSQ